MFYYLLFNSSFIKSKDIKEKLISTIIYGSFIYLIIHAIISFSFHKYNILKYFWVFFLIDIFTLISKNNTSIINCIFKEDCKTNYIKENIKENIKEKEYLIKEKNMKSIIKKTKGSNRENRIENKKNISFNREEILEFDKNEPVKNLKINIIEDVNRNNNDIENLNLTLDNLEKLNNINEIEIPTFKNDNLGSSIIKELKKDEDASDATSFIDLENFEKTAFG